MEIFIIVILVIVIIVCLYKHNIETFISKTLVCNDHLDDNKVNECYYVVDEFNDQIEASKQLTKINTFINNIIEYMDNKYIKEGLLIKGRTFETFPLSRYENMVTNMKKNYNSKVLSENNPSSNINTSFVENKGKVAFSICLRHKTGPNKGKLIDDFNLLLYVVLHELAHLSTETFGHDEIFWQNYAILMKNATEAKLYIPINYRITPTNYCSLIIDSNPFFENIRI